MINPKRCSGRTRVLLTTADGRLFGQINTQPMAYAAGRFIPAYQIPVTYRLIPAFKRATLQ